MSLPYNFREDGKNVFINILESKPADELPELLRHIANLIEGGMNEGYYPTWELVEDTESGKE